MAARRTGRAVRAPREGGAVKVMRRRHSAQSSRDLAGSSPSTPGAANDPSSSSSDDDDDDDDDDDAADWPPAAAARAPFLPREGGDCFDRIPRGCLGDILAWRLEDVGAVACCSSSLRTAVAGERRWLLARWRRRRGWPPVESEGGGAKDATAAFVAFSATARDPAAAAEFFAAAGRRDLEAMAALSRRGASQRGTDAAGWTALHAAATRGDDAVVRFFLAHRDDGARDGALVASKDATGRTPLHASADAYHKKNAIPRLLLRNGADANARDADGTTPLYLAARLGRSSVARVLLRGGRADASLAPWRGPHKGETPLEAARRDPNGRRGCRHVAALLATGDEAGEWFANDFPTRFLRRTAQLEYSDHGNSSDGGAAAAAAPTPAKARRTATLLVFVLLASLRLNAFLDRWRYWGLAKAAVRSRWRLGPRLWLDEALLGYDAPEDAEELGWAEDGES